MKTKVEGLNEWKRRASDEDLLSPASHFFGGWDAAMAAVKADLLESRALLWRRQVVRTRHLPASGHHRDYWTRTKVQKPHPNAEAFERYRKVTEATAPSKEEYEAWAAKYPSRHDKPPESPGSMKTGIASWDLKDMQAAADSAFVVDPPPHPKAPPLAPSVPVWPKAEQDRETFWRNAGFHGEVPPRIQ